MTAPEELKGAKGDMLIARVATPIVAVILYGIYKLITLGVSLDFYLDTYTPVLGGVAAIAGLFVYYLIVTAPDKVSWRNLLALFGFLPYVLSLYVIGYLGVYMIYRGLSGAFSVWLVIGGLFWILVGYRILNQFYLITEIVRQHDEASKA